MDELPREDGRHAPEEGEEDDLPTAVGGEEKDHNQGAGVAGPIYERAGSSGTTIQLAHPGPHLSRGGPEAKCPTFKVQGRVRSPKSEALGRTLDIRHWTNVGLRTLDLGRRSGIAKRR